MKSKEIEELNNIKIENLFSQLGTAVALCEYVPNQENNLTDICFLDVNEEFLSLFQIDYNVIIGKTLRRIFPRINRVWINSFKPLVENNKSVQFSEYLEELDRYFKIHSFSLYGGRFIIIMTDITNEVTVNNRMKHLNSALETLRNTVRASFEFNDVDSFLQKVCEILVNERGYYNSAYIAKYNSRNEINKVYSAGFGDKTETLEKYVLAGDRMECQKNIDPAGKLKVIHTPKRKCENCPMADQHKNKAIFSILLKFRKTKLGLLVVSLENNFAYDQEEVNLFSELAKDISFTLHRYFLEEKARIAEYEIKSSHLKIQNQNEILKNLNYKLELTNQDLKAEQQKVVAAEALKSTFLANMSHEIRTPLNGILGFVQLLQSGSLPAEKQKEYLSIINSSSTYLLDVLSNILDLSKIESNQVTLNESEASLHRMLKELYDFFNFKLITEGEKKLSFSYTTTSQVDKINVDITKLKQVLTNIINNAIKFTNEGEIKYGYELINDKIKFFVIDKGIGIRDVDSKIIFERFRQSDDSSTRHYGGAGLGLTICKAIIEKMGGEIWFENNKDKGTTFYFTIPYNQIEEEHIDYTEVIKQKSAGKRNVLIVEDDAISAEYISEVLDEREFNLIYTRDGKEAIEFCKMNNDLDLILMDIQLPVVSGLDATREIRKFNKEIPIIAQTANAFNTDREMCINAGCSDYISKPITPDTLKKMVRQYIT